VAKKWSAALYVLKKLRVQYEEWNTTKVVGVKMGV